ncbi:T9SS type A sorting domain-containing protein [Polaribacter vadi]|uniref:T9SS type A sorting domain-containing protein n=1 Tax=Polaribacter TaxID=52959 RepID=UPI001C098848|nr:MULTISPECIES: T9SS type A sorting domain-containing protein [Polaribacter]MBU3011373.1 T9SS type A sorting domain-containing protein [Polaribacter vadi]MDO6741185.1 T9SS type A sorting domain-containing protein [Polaribacter sp. 1_MG-2023]
MKSKENTSMNTAKSSILVLIICLLFGAYNTKAQAEDPQQGLRANWLRGTWGLNWKPVDLYNGGHEGLSIKPFLNQISHLKTIDYIQVHLGESSIKSSVHMGPHPLLESFWEGDTDGNGDPINLVVPRASFGEDPFLEVIKDVRAAGMKVMVYVNSSNMLNRSGSTNPDYIPNITERWKAWCDTNVEAQAFIASQSYHTGIWNAATGTYVDATSTYPNRKYMFCYAEFVLEVYAERYGNLIDSWCFDSGSYMALNGDTQTNGVYEDQMIFNAFKAACHAGNPNAALSFQNSPERQTEELNPFSEAVHADDFMFGHPYNGGKDGGSHTIGDPSLYSRNYAHIEKIKETNGNVHSGIDPQTWTWDDKVVGHYDPPMSTTSWNGGNTPALRDDEFNLWNLEAVQYGGAISWGLPLQGKSSGDNNKYIANTWALEQLNGMDAHLMKLESPGAPNWARQETVLSTAIIGESYNHILVDGTDFWDPEEVGVTGLSIVSSNLPSWLTIAQTTSGTWTLSGTPTETINTEYKLVFRAQDADGASDRELMLKVLTHHSGFTDLGNGSPVWSAASYNLSEGKIALSYNDNLKLGTHFYDFEGDDLTITKTAGADWLQIEEIATGYWQLSGTPAESDEGENSFTFMLSDGTNSSTAEILITVSRVVISDENVKIIAEASTNYGINTVAKMYSAVQTAPDGLATFRISIDVTPPTGQAIISGISGGDATANSWGIGDGTDDNQDDVFRGLENEWTESINNIQIVDFNSNGGDLTTENITMYFKAITIVNSQSPNDFVAFKVDDVVSDFGKAENKTETIDIEAVTSSSKITDFAVGTGGTSVSSNKWSVDSISVLVDFNETLSNTDINVDKEKVFNLYPNPANNRISFNMPLHAVKIIDVTGKELKTFSKETQNIDISDFISGIYVLKGISTEGKTIINKFIKHTSK